VAENNPALAQLENPQLLRSQAVIARANPDSERPAFMDNALVFLNLAKAELFTANPDNLF
jgi:hypothetical protein